MTVRWPPQRVVELIQPGDGIEWWEEIAWLWENHTDKMVDLVRSIISDGVKEPIQIGIRKSGVMRMWDGHHRVAACLALALSDMPIDFYTENDMT